MERVFPLLSTPLPRLTYLGNVNRMSPKRARVQLQADRVVKTYTEAGAAEYEANFYQLVPWACPRLLAMDDWSLAIERLTPARKRPAWRPHQQLYQLLTRLHAEGVHHRDVHPGNIVQSRTGEPLLIDWETAIIQPSEVSYDLHGPEASGIAPPEIHAGIIPQWWGSDQAASIKNRWKHGVPAEAA